MNIADELFEIWSAKPAKKSSEKIEVEKSKRKSEGSKTEVESAEAKTEIGSLLDLLMDVQEPHGEKPNPSKKIGGNFMAAIRNIQKSAEKLGISKEAGTFCKDGTLYIHDSHRIVKSKYDFIGAGENPKGFDAERFFETFKSSKKISSPSFEELAEMVKKTRREAGKRKPTRVLYQFKNGLTVNADYLLDAMAITGSSEFYCSDNKSPLIFKSEDDFYEVVVRPVNPSEKFQGCRIA